MKAIISATTIKSNKSCLPLGKLTVNKVLKVHTYHRVIVTLSVYPL